MISIIKEKETTEVPTWFVIVLHGVFHKEFHVLCVSDDFFSCSCMMFESKGFICSHILRVFKFFDILELPDKYILSRWERKTRRFDHSKSKDIGHNFMEWNGRMHSLFLRMSYQASKSAVARSLMEDMFEQNMDKIYEASMREEISKDGDIFKNVESSIGNLKGLKMKEGKRRTKRMKPLHEVRKKKTKKFNVQVEEIKSNGYKFTAELLFQEELDEPRVEADAIGGSEPDILVEEAEPGGGDYVGSGEPGQDRNVDELLLKGDKQRHAGHRNPASTLHGDTGLLMTGLEIRAFKRNSERGEDENERTGEAKKKEKPIGEFISNGAHPMEDGLLNELSPFTLSPVSACSAHATSRPFIDIL
ncbi:FAR1-related sequence 12 [Striga asiatica]|uniref:Protein FAR1-RELATED SEQUENCE n=1 Tax=Striga asiatica TaxID=4170 RepID=A0A5A7QPR9_STRAF|nr:FAR1-related sequence 12 [Striga asiatica]